MTRPIKTSNQRPTWISFSKVFSKIFSMKNDFFFLQEAMTQSGSGSSVHILNGNGNPDFLPLPVGVDDHQDRKERLIFFSLVLNKKNVKLY